MSIVNRPDLVEKLRAAFGVLRGQVGATLSDELVPVVIVEDVSGPDVVSTQHPVTALGSSSSLAGGATFFSKVGLQNPVGSGIDIFVELVLIFATASSQATVRTSAIAANPNAGIRQFLDRRVTGAPTGIIWDENATVSLGTEILEIRMIEGMFQVKLGMTLAPGDSIHTQPSSANAALQTVHYFWTERIRRE